MSMTTSVISGEAAETDSDDGDTNYGNNKLPSSVKMTASVQGEIVNGEDSESDTDTNESKPKAKGREPQVTANPNVRVKRHFDSLLHKKLSENNIAVHKNLNAFFASTVSEAAASLNHTDRQLMKSQLTLQSALNSLRTLNANSLAIKNKLRNIAVDDNYLHNLVTTRNKCDA